MVAEVHLDQGLDASMLVRMEDIKRLSSVEPKFSSQNLESSWERPRRCPKAEKRRSTIMGDFAFLLFYDNYTSTWFPTSHPPPSNVHEFILTAFSCTGWTPREIKAACSQSSHSGEHLGEN